jgi:hypothetical protein
MHEFSKYIVEDGFDIEQDRFFDLLLREMGELEETKRYDEE